MTIDEIAADIYANAKAHGFHEEPLRTFIADTTANIHGEVSEFWEAFRHHTLDKPCDKAGEMTTLGLDLLTCEEEEIADIIIRAFDTHERLRAEGLSKKSVAQIILTKHTFNRSRPYKHGNKAA